MMLHPRGAEGQAGRETNTFQDSLGTERRKRAGTSRVRDEIAYVLKKRRAQRKNRLCVRAKGSIRQLSYVYPVIILTPM